MSSLPTRSTTTVVYGAMGGVACVLLAQWILLSVAVEGYMGGRADLLAWCTAASGLCFIFAFWVIRHLR